MRACDDLLRRARLISKKEPYQGRVAWNKQQDLSELVKEYEAACHLSAGPDRGRSEHWTGKAGMLKSRLAVMLDAMDGGFKAERDR